jgi:glycosyltransferase involved in cell wall biosynthesis
MRVLHVIPAVAPRYGGPSGAVISMCRALRDAELTTLLASTDADGPRRLDVPLGAETTYEGVPAIFFRRQWSEAFKVSLPLASWLRENTSRFDVVHIHAVFNHPCIAAGASAQRAGVPYVVRPLGTLDPWSLAQKRVRKRLFLWTGGRKLLDGAAAIQYTTQREKDLAERALGLTRGIVIPNGVDDAFSPGPHAAHDEFRRATGLPPAATYVLVLSRLHPKKAIELLLQAFASAARRVSSVVLVIAGDGEPEYVASLRSLAERLCPPGSVSFPGWITGEQRIEALRGAALLALTSRQENFGLAAAEAMACGTPVLVSRDVNLADEISEARAGWVTPLDEAAIEEALTHALQDPDERRRRGVAAARLVDGRFRWRTVAGLLEQVYGSLLERPAAVASTHCGAGASADG